MFMWLFGLAFIYRQGCGCARLCVCVGHHLFIGNIQQQQTERLKCSFMSTFLHGHQSIYETLYVCLKPHFHHLYVHINSSRKVENTLSGSCKIGLRLLHILLPQWGRGECPPPGQTSQPTSRKRRLNAAMLRTSWWVWSAAEHTTFNSHYGPG